MFLSRENTGRVGYQENDQMENMDIKIQVNKSNYYLHSDGRRINIHSACQSIPNIVGGLFLYSNLIYGIPWKLTMAYLSPGKF